MTDPHAKRRQADGRNAWTKMGLTPGAREQFVAWLHMEGLTEALQGADYLGREDNEVGCLDFYTVPPGNDPYRPTPSLDSARMTKTVIDPLSGRPITYPDPDRKGTKAHD